MKIELYEDPGSGKCHVAEFIDGLTPLMRAKTLRTLDLLEEFGEKLRRPYSAYLRDGVFELRTQQGGMINRILFFFAGDKAVLTHGFIKKTDEVPKEELRRAIDVRKAYLAHKREEDKR